MIRLTNLEKAYQTGPVQTFVLRQIKLHIAEGEFVTIMGPSGAGKTTLLSILGMLDAAWSGDQKAVHRLRFPELPPDRQPDGGRDPRPAALLPQRAAGATAGDGGRGPRPLSHRRQERPLPLPALGRPAAA